MKKYCTLVLQATVSDSEREEFLTRLNDGFRKIGVTPEITITPLAEGEPVRQPTITRTDHFIC